MNTAKTITISGISKSVTIFIVTSQAIMMAWTIVCSMLHTGPFTAAVITYLCYGVYVVYSVRFNNPLFIKLLIFGTVAGFVELLADHYSISGINALVYPGGEAMLWTSPLYMPFAWANVFVQLGYYSLLLIRWKGIKTASIIMAVLGGMYIPFYEHFADEAGWWHYVNVSKIFSAPYYIIICEALISLTLPVCVYLASKKNYTWDVGLGLAEGLWILGSAMLAYSIAP